MNKKPGRNDPCPCGSGKKFKKCCEGKERKIQATKIESKDFSKGLGSFFQAHTAHIPKKTQPSEAPSQKETEEKQDS